MKRERGKAASHFIKSPSLIYLDATASVGPEREVGRVPVVGSDVEDGTDLGGGVGEEAAIPSRRRVNLSTFAVSQHDESIG